ncbi:MAG TPA: hypothetical protein VHE35_20765, partial [Kofleriaceae bacterium]|nr:hypothetical protein [Kofleriaceae bacterium]
DAAVARAAPAVDAAAAIDAAMPPPLAIHVTSIFNGHSLDITVLASGALAVAFDHAPLDTGSGPAALIAQLEAKLGGPRAAKKLPADALQWLLGNVRLFGVTPGPGASLAQVATSADDAARLAADWPPPPASIGFRVDPTLATLHETDSGPRVDAWFTTVQPGGGGPCTRLFQSGAVMHKDGTLELARRELNHHGPGCDTP